MSSMRAKFGRPPEPVPAGVAKFRPYVRLSPDVLARLDLLASKTLRPTSVEATAALLAYMEAHQTLPDAPDVDPTHESTRFQLRADVVRALDDRVGVEHRERHMVAAISWWCSRS